MAEQVGLEEFELCERCQSQQPLGFKFCGNCGVRNESIQKEQINSAFQIESNLKFLFAYIFIVLFALIINTYIEETFLTVVTVSISFAIIDLVFAIRQPDCFNLLKKQLSVVPIVLVVATFSVTGILVTFLGNGLNELLFQESYSYMYPFYETEFPLLYALLFVAVFPAIFEELAFRGFVFNNLEKVAGMKSAVWGSSFLFALVHFSIISLIWLVPFALLLTYIRRKSGSIGYGMIGHFCHNATVVYLDYAAVL